MLASAVSAVAERKASAATHADKSKKCDTAFRFNHG